VTDTDFTLTADGDIDDLPRTLRREREAREQAAREDEARKRRATLTHDFAPAGAAPDLEHMQEAPAATVTRFDVPFTHLMVFFIKAVIAAIPALILLGALLWLAGDVLRNLFPWLVKMQILIRFPN